MISKRALGMLLAELIGTFVLAMIVLSINRYGLPIFTAAAAGIVFTTMYAALGSISGGHFNPAVTLGYLSMRRVSIAKAVAYLCAQFIAAVLAWKLYEWFTDNKINLLTTEFDWKVFTAELIGTAVLGFAIAAVLLKKFDGYLAAATVGAGLFIGSSVASLVAQAGAINPAVALSLGFRPENAGYLAYFLGPVIGAIAGMFLFRLIFNAEVSTPKPIELKKPVATTTASISTPAKKSTKKAPAKKKPTAKKKTTTRTRSK